MLYIRGHRPLLIETEFFGVDTFVYHYYFYIYENDSYSSLSCCFFQLLQ